MKSYFQTPILLLVFNRPEISNKVFNEIRKIKPTKLFIAADGPRNASDKILCEETLNIIKLIDWDCELKTLIRSENMGCGRAVNEGISWFFNHVDEGIILEDDCFPLDSFFEFCEKMLEKYRDNGKVMHISGSNFQMGITRGLANETYYYSRYPLIWGWATWKRAWRYYNFELPNFLDKSVREMGSFFIYATYKVNSSQINTWDIQWSYCVYKNKGICITPNVNLIKNLGFGEDSTHTNKIPKWEKLMVYGEIEKITSPKNIEICLEADSFQKKNIYRLSLQKFLLNRITYLSCKMEQIYSKIFI